MPKSKEPKPVPLPEEGPMTANPFENPSPNRIEQHSDLDLGSRENLSLVTRVGEHAVMLHRPLSSSAYDRLNNETSMAS